MLLASSGLGPGVLSALSSAQDGPTESAPAHTLAMPAKKAALSIGSPYFTPSSDLSPVTQLQQGQQTV